MGLPEAPPAEQPFDGQALVERLMQSYSSGPRAMHHLGAYELPQASEVAHCLEEVRVLVFPGFVGSPLVGASPSEVRAYITLKLADLSRRLSRQVYRGLHHRCQLIKGSRDLDCAHCALQADGIVKSFLDALPEMRARLA